MIRLVVYKNKGLYTGLDCEGHSSKTNGEKGTNLVCAGVSALLQTLFLYLKNEKLIDSVKMADGILFFRLTEIRNPKLAILVDQAFKMIWIGMESIAQDHSGDIELQQVEDPSLDKRAVS